MTTTTHDNQQATGSGRSVLRSAYQRSVANYWDREKDPVNIRLGDVDGLYHHHYGIGDYDAAVLEAPEPTRDEAIIAEMHRLESAQADLLLDHLGEVEAEDRVLDLGCGRGGTSFMSNLRFGARVDGVSISQVQVDFANEQAAERAVSDRVRFHFRNMLDTGFDTGSRAAAWNNESTMYVDLHELFAEVGRVLHFGGRYVTITGCYNDVTGGRSKAVSHIDQHYTCDIHPRSRYFRALADNGFVPMQVIDLTDLTIPYWELRAQSPVRTGIEDAFLTAYREGSFHYLLIAADYVGN
jgi:geranyl diphosphate 2-C-methyltransferase